jgi:hypothetical protein
VDGVYARNETKETALQYICAFGRTLRRQVVEIVVVVPQRLCQRLEDINRLFFWKMCKLAWIGKFANEDGLN